MPRLPVYLPGWESGWEPGSSGGDSGGRSHSWEHCVLREGVEPSSQWKVFLYIMYFFTFGGFFLYNFNKDCKQRLRLWWFFFFFLKYWLSWCLGALQVLYRGQRFCFFSSSVLISVLSLNPRSCLTWRWWNPVCCRPLSSNGAMFFPLYSTEPSCLCKCCMVLTLDRAYKNKTWWRCCSLVLILFDRLWQWADVTASKPGFGWHLSFIHQVSNWGHNSVLEKELWRKLSRGGEWSLRKKCVLTVEDWAFGLKVAEGLDWWTPWMWLVESGETGWFELYLLYFNHSVHKVSTVESVTCLQFWLLNKDAKKLLVSGLLFKKDLQLGSWAAWSISVGYGVVQWEMA